MAQGLPCLNPTCDHQFSPSDVQSASALSCPKCGNVFQLGTAAPAASTPSVPRARRAAAPVAERDPARPAPAEHQASADVAHVKTARRAAAKPVAPSNYEQDIPEAKRESDEDTSFPVTDFVPSSVYGQRSSTLEPWKLGLIIGGVIGVVALICVVVVMLLPLFDGGNGERLFGGEKYQGNIHNAKRSPEKAFELLIPYDKVKGDTWRPNSEIKRRLKAVIALERDIVVGDGQSDKVWLAVAGHDYDHQLPRDSELLKRSIEKLEMCFGDRLELEPQPDIGKVDGRATQVLKFGGEINGTAWRGECHTFTEKGFGFWIFIGGPDFDTSRQQFANLHKQQGMGFRVATNRGVWRQRPPTLETFEASKAPLRLKAPKEIWTSFKATEEDEHGVLFILGRDDEGSQQDPDKNLRNATFLVIDKKLKTANTKEAIQVARDYVLETYKKVRKEYTFKLLKEDASKDGVLHAIGKEPGRIVEFSLMRPSGPWKYVLVGVIHRPDHFYIIRGECTVDYQQAWRGEFLDILRTVEFLEN